MAIFSHERCFNSLLSLHSDSTHFVTLCGSILCLFCKIKPVRTLDVDFIIQWCMDITRSLTIGPKAQARKFPLFLSPDSSPQLLIRVVTLLFFHSGAIYHVHRKHGALTRNLSTNTATADNLKHTSDPKTLSFTRNDPWRRKGLARLTSRAFVVIFPFSSRDRYCLCQTAFDGKRDLNN